MLAAAASSSPERQIHGLRRAAPADRVGVRQLRQNLSVYLERVIAGEALQVTARGRAVALLIPLPGTASAVERLVASGRATAAHGDLLSLGPPRGRPSRRVSLALEATREERL
jgi:prevent-host-death family protein